jgi:hypothetical protein
MCVVGTENTIACFKLDFDHLKRLRAGIYGPSNAMSFAHEISFE